MPPARSTPANADLKLSGLWNAMTGIALISGVVNILALTSPLFMLQVYDRVLASRSVPTLVGLAVLAAALYSIQGMLDILRGRVLLRIGERFDRQNSRRVHDAVIRLPLSTRMPGDGLQPLRDLDNIRGFLSGTGPATFCDLPWMPLYLGICFLFHLWIGVTALVGAAVLISLALLTNALSAKAVRETMSHNMARNAQLEASRRNAEVIVAMGLIDRLGHRWQETTGDYLLANRRSGDIATGLGGAARALRMMLQSAILGVGAYLVIQQEASAGIMIASSIMMGRALAPVDQAIGSWKPLLMARQSWARLGELLSQLPAAADVMALPAPEKRLSVENVAVVPPGQKKPTIAGIAFTADAGSAVGIIGPSGSGKSTLSRVLVGAWAPAVGKIRLDNAALDHWDRQILGQHIGYLPQGVDLFAGTIAENISRFEDSPDPAAIVKAARVAGVHDLILRFEQGYDTPVGEAGAELSAGQRQRVGLARAVYRDPFLVVLDEPNSNLDAEGEASVVKLVSAVRERGGIAIVVAHRPSALEVVDHVLMVEDGRQKAFGPRDTVLQKVLKPGSAAAPARRGYPVTGAIVSPLRVVATDMMSRDNRDEKDGADVN